MAEPQPHEVSGASDLSAGTSESTLQLNLKILGSKIYSFNVDKNISVAAFKEQIASQSGIPAGHQRLIFRGKVLKDEHLLSDYKVENGDTLHLVERQPQSASGSSTGGEATSSNSGRGDDSSAGGPHNRIGPFAHSIVLGTLNVADAGEAVAPDINRVIGAVLNSIGLGNQGGGVQTSALSSLVNQTEGSQVNASSQSQDGNQFVRLQVSNGQSPSHITQIPLGPAVNAPALNAPIPDSLNTLIEFINRMELSFSRIGHQQNHSPTNNTDLPTVELPSNSLGLPTIEALSIVLQHAHRLLSDHAVQALSHTADLLNQEGGSNDPAVRGQVQEESVQLGMAIQHLGALLLELGRTILTLRMGQSLAESFVNAGPAVYISPSGPNPIMAQPFPLQTSSLFTASSGGSPTPIPMGTVGASSIARNVNIHSHAGGAHAPLVSTVGNRAHTVEGIHGGHVNATESGDSGQARGLSGVNNTATSVPLQQGMVSIPGAGPPGIGVSQAPGASSISPEVAAINVQARRVLSNTQNANHAPSEGQVVSTNQGKHAGDVGTDEEMSWQNSMAADTNNTVTDDAMMDDQKAENEIHQADIKKMVDVNSSNEPSTSSEGVSHKSGNDNQDGSSHCPLGLGIGGLQPKRKQPRAQTIVRHGASVGAQIQQSRAAGREVLQSRTSLSTMGSTTPLPSGQSEPLPQGSGRGVSQTRQNTDGQSDVADEMSQLLDSPVLDGLLSGVSQQTGIGSPDMLRNMLQQFTQNPAMRNMVNQIAQQVDSHDLGSMFSGLDRGPGGGIDLGRMMQQMMPIVSQAFGGASPVSQLAPPSEQILSRGTATINNHTQHIDLNPVVEMLVNQDSTEEIFDCMVGSALDVSSDDISRETIVNALCSQGHLVQEFMEMLHHDLSKRLQSEKGS